MGNSLNAITGLFKVMYGDHLFDNLTESSYKDLFVNLEKHYLILSNDIFLIACISLDTHKVVFKCKDFETFLIEYPKYV